MSQFEQQQKNNKEESLEQNSKKENFVQQDSLEDPILQKSSMKIVQQNAVDVLGQPKDEHIPQEEDNQRALQRDVDNPINDRFQDRSDDVSKQEPSKIFGGLQSAYEEFQESHTEQNREEFEHPETLVGDQKTSHENVEESQSIGGGRLQFTRPSGRIISSTTSQIFQDAVEGKNLFTSRDDITHHDATMSDFERPRFEGEENQEGENKKQSKEEGISTESYTLLRSMNQSKHRSSIQVQPIHVSKEQSKQWNISSGTQTLLSSSQGTLIVSSTDIGESKGSFVNKNSNDEIDSGEKETRGEKESHQNNTNDPFKAKK
jgi:hypothetical protein